MPMMIFIRGDHDAERTRETQAFFAEIRRDGHTYRRFHDRMDLLPEIRQALSRMLRETFGIAIGEEAPGESMETGRASLFEQQLLDVAGTNLDLVLAAEWLRAVGYPAGPTALSQSVILHALREKGLVRKNAEGAGFKAMAAGLLFLGKHPNLQFAQCRILADAYAGTDPDPNPKDQNTFSGPAPRMIGQVVDFAMTNTRHPIRVVRINRVKLDEYPREVIREAIVNAIAHRDYEDAARPIYVKLFFDRIELLSPGDLIRPLTIAKLHRGDYEPCSRNPMLAQYLSQMNLMEQRGSGISRMHTAMVNHGLETPAYSFRDGYFRVVLQGPGDDVERLKVPSGTGVSASVEERMTERQRKMAEMLARGQALTSAYCRRAFGISGVTAARDFSVLVENGIAERVGEGRGTRYIFRGENR